MCANSTKATGIVFIMEQLLCCTAQVRYVHAPLFILWSCALDPLETILTTSLKFFALVIYACLGCWFKESYSRA